MDTNLIVPNAEGEQFIEEVALGYIEAIDFTENRNDEFPDHGCIEPTYESATVAAKICRAFLLSVWCTALDYWKVHGVTPNRIGHDLWLTSQGHGAGFWDRGVDVESEKILTDASKAFANIYIWPTEAGSAKFVIDGFED
jgi:hypothetical protein